jgi:hypothetical protein
MELWPAIMAPRAFQFLETTPRCYEPSKRRQAGSTDRLNGGWAGCHDRFFIRAAGRRENVSLDSPFHGTSKWLITLAGQDEFLSQKFPTPFPVLQRLETTKGGTHPEERLGDGGVAHCSGDVGSAATTQTGQQCSFNDSRKAPTMDL